MACAASGWVRGVFVQRLREDDAIDELYLRMSGIGVTGATLLGLMLPAATSLRSLEYATNPNPNPSPNPNPLSAPIDTHLLSHCPGPSPPDSFYWNNIGPEGASALAAVLKETHITNLKCAATP